MNRCSNIFFSATFTALLLVAGLVQAQVPTASAGVRALPIATDAVAARMQFLAWPNVVVAGRVAQFSPGARIRDAQNLIVTPASLTGQTAIVRYRTDAQGQVGDTWLLTADEIAAMPPLPGFLTGP